MGKKTISVKGLQITGYETDYVFQTIEKNNSFYEESMLDKWTSLVESPECILDVGANLGNHTLYWAQKFPDSKIVSLEPFADNYCCLCENVENNNLQNVNPLRIAAGEREGVVEVSSFDPENYGSTEFRYAEDETENTTPVRTLDSIVNELGMTKVGLIKIDTEGFELSIIKGMEGILSKCDPIIWIECRANHIKEILRILSAHKYILLDFERANLIFAPAQKGRETTISITRLLAENLTLTEKVDNYYHDYETAKKWLIAKDKKLVQVEEQCREVEGKLEKGDKEEKALIEKLDDAERVLEENRNLLIALRRQMQQLNAEVSRLKHKTSEYEGKLNKVYCTWYGKIALRCYKVLKRIKHLVVRRR